MTAHNLNLSLCFDDSKKFLICGELVKFNLKITSPEFESEPREFLERIGASVDSIEISDIISDYSMSTTASSSIDSFKGKKMRSVESLSNLLSRAAKADQRVSNHSKDSQQSMSSVTASRRFNSLSMNRASESKAFWNSEDEAIFIPLEAFIDPECLKTSHKATVRIKVSLNELVPIDALEALKLGFNEFKWTDSVSSAAQSSHRLEKIGQIETCFTVLRPLEVSLRTHNLSSNQVILQINVEFNHEIGEELNGNLRIETVEINFSDSFTSKKAFKITPISDKQVPFVFETSPQQYSLLFNWTLLEEQQIPQDDFHLRVELGGKLKSSELSLSFETFVPIFNLFPVSVFPSGVKITSTKLIGHETLKVFEPFQLEIILHNFEKDTKSLQLDIQSAQVNKNEHSNKSDDSRISVRSQVKEWFRLEQLKNSPGLVLMSPLTPLNIENIPSGGSKAIRLKILPMKRGIFNLKDEIKILNRSTGGKCMKFEEIIIKVE